MQTFINPAKEKWNEIVKRPQLNDVDLMKTVSGILTDVKINGDAALRKYSLQFEKVDLSDFYVSEPEISAAILLVDEELKHAIQVAKANIEKFHRSQIEQPAKIETSDGVICWRRSVGIEKVGLYIPGGTAPLFSTLLMLAIPALLAGCKDIVVCTPPGTNGKINEVILYVSRLLGLKNIFKIGGVQAIGAMAFGTASIPAVYKIFGPGNQYVTAAKKIVNSEGVSMDMPAGPSEVAVYADESCIPEFVAADLLSQAEHGIDSQVMLIAPSQKIIDLVRNEMDKQLNDLSRKEIIMNSLTNARFIVMESADASFDLLNEYAPEHLIIASDNAEELSYKVVNAGSVFIGHYSPESAGDYASGTNHTLPTNGYAKAYSGVSIDSFVKKITFQNITREGIKSLGSTVEAMATAEGLDAHKHAISVRLKNI